MERTWIGLGVGACLGLALGIGVIVVFEGLDRLDSDQAAIVGAITATGGAAVGAVVGGVKDILKAIHQITRRDAGVEMEADYRDPDRPRR